MISLMMEEESSDLAVDECDGSSTSDTTEGPETHDVESIDCDIEHDAEKIELFHHNVVFTTWI